MLTYEGPHYLDQFRWLAGSDYETANSVSMGRYASGGDGEDNCIAGMTFKSGASAVLLEGMSELGGRYEEWRIAGTIGTIESVGGTVRLGRGDWTDVDYAYKNDEPLVRVREAGQRRGVSDVDDRVLRVAEQHHREAPAVVHRPRRQGRPRGRADAAGVGREGAAGPHPVQHVGFLLPWREKVRMRGSRAAAAVSGRGH